MTYPLTSVGDEDHQAHTAWLARGRTGPGRFARRAVSITGPLPNRDLLAAAELVDVDLTTAQLTDLSAAAAELTRCDLSGCTLSTVSLDAAHMRDCDLRDSALEQVSAMAIELVAGTLHSARLVHVDCTKSRWTHVVMSHIRASETRLTSAQLTRCDLQHSDLRGCDLTDAHFVSCDLRDADLSGCHLDGAVFESCDMRGIRASVDLESLTTSACLIGPLGDESAPMAGVGAPGGLYESHQQDIEQALAGEQRLDLYVPLEGIEPARQGMWIAYLGHVAQGLRPDQNLALHIHLGDGRAPCLMEEDSPTHRAERARDQLDSVISALTTAQVVHPSLKGRIQYRLTDLTLLLALQRRQLQTLRAKWSAAPGIDLDQTAATDQIRRARTTAEAHLWMDIAGLLTPRRQRLVAQDNQLISVYQARHRQGHEATTPFLIDDPDAPDHELGDGVSPCLGPAQFILHGERLASAVPADPKHLSDDLHPRAVRQLELAARCFEQALRFVPEGAAGIPETAFRTTVGRRMHQASTSRFEATRLRAVMQALQTLARAYRAEHTLLQGAMDPEPLDDEALRTQLTRYLRGFVDPLQNDVTLTMALRPRPSDYARVFQPNIAASLQHFYTPFWDAFQQIQRDPSQTEVQVVVARSEAFHTAPVGFPQGYVRLAPYLRPGVLWGAWRFLAPGRALGMRYDGLARIDDRWVWFPKPYRALQRALQQSQDQGLP